MKGCQEITELLEKGNITLLTPREKVAVRIHLLFCKLCREFQKDSKIMDKAIKKALNSSEQISFSPAEKEKMILLLKGK